jgi:MFS transporter, MHS family, proline/betaine transporter
VFGGFTPALVTWLLGATGDKSAPGYYLILTATISLAALAWVSRVPMETLPRRAAA